LFNKKSFLRPCRKYNVLFRAYESLHFAIASFA